MIRGLDAKSPKAAASAWKSRWLAPLRGDFGKGGERVAWFLVGFLLGLVANVFTARSCILAGGHPLAVRFLLIPFVSGAIVAALGMDLGVKIAFFVALILQFLARFLFA